MASLHPPRRPAVAGAGSAPALAAQEGRGRTARPDAADRGRTTGAGGNATRPFRRPRRCPSRPASTTQRRHCGRTRRLPVDLASLIERLLGEDEELALQSETLVGPGQLLRSDGELLPSQVPRLGADASLVSGDVELAPGDVELLLGRFQLAPGGGQ